MNERMGPHSSAIALLLGLLLVGLWVPTRDLAVLTVAGLLLVIGVIGDRLKKAPGGWEFYRARFAKKLRDEVPPPVSGGWSVTATGTVESMAGGSGEARAGAAEGRGAALEATVAARSHVMATLDSIDTAANPEELAERVVEYVGLRSTPTLRGLSDERIRHEGELFQVILELQTWRTRGRTPQDIRRLDSALRRIEVFWTRPELLSDQEVADLTARVGALIADMREQS